jgi:hypothetical protein
MPFSRLFLVVLPLACTAARADVIVDAGFGFSFVVDSSNGVAFVAPGTTAFTFAFAYSPGGLQEASQSGGSFARSIATTGFAGGRAIGVAELDQLSGSAFSGSAFSEVVLQNQSNGFARSEGRAVLTGNIDVSGAASVATLFTIDISGGRSLRTSGTGLGAASGLILTLSLLDFPTPIFSYGNLLSIGPNDFVDVTAPPSLTSTINLAPGTYPFTLTLDSDAAGASTAPEPASLFLLGTAAVMAVAFFRRRTPSMAIRRSHVDS